MLKKFNRSSKFSRSNDLDFENILYVEDEDANWNVAELHLRGKYNIKRARNAKEAFTMLGKEEFNLLLLDIQLAGSDYDGIEICKILRKRPGQPIPPEAKQLNCETLPIVFVTAYSERYSKESLLEVGGDEMVKKPVDFTRLTLVSSRLIIKKIHQL
ncbi:MAG: response regulator [Deltaproteobacteria bacterium]|nr:response regulator [Deltaproteobacteria bacterium]MBN2671864.1 response regulator [Deltaproteobacteria bacterium]